MFRRDRERQPDAEEPRAVLLVDREGFIRAVMNEDSSGVMAYRTLDSESADGRALLATPRKQPDAPPRGAPAAAGERAGGPQGEAAAAAAAQAQLRLSCDTRLFACPSERTCKLKSRGRRHQKASCA